jgi:hypothetical protein
MAELPKDIYPTVMLGFFVERREIMKKLVTEVPESPAEEDPPRAAQVVKQSKEHKAGFVIRLFEGDVPLPITYWIFYVFIANCAYLVLSKIAENYYFSITSSTIGTWAYNGACAFVVVYWAFILTSIWRSAGKYQGRAAWASLARASAVLGVISVIGFVVSEFQIIGKTDLMLKDEIEMANESLPTMIDEGIRFDQVSIQDRDIHYKYTFIDLRAEEIDASKLRGLMSPALKETSCKGKETSSLLKEGRKLTSSYHGRDNIHIATITIQESDCL